MFYNFEDKHFQGSVKNLLKFFILKIKYLCAIVCLTQLKVMSELYILTVHNNEGSMNAWSCILCILQYLAAHNIIADCQLPPIENVQ